MILLPVLMVSLAAQIPAQGQTPPKAPPPRTTATSIPSPIKLPAVQPNQSVLPNAPLSVEEAARIALMRQPSLGDTVGALEMARGHTKIVGAALNPQLILSAGYDSVSSISGRGNPPIQAPLSMTPAGASPLYSIDGAAGVKQLLFDFNQTRNLVRQSRALERVAAANLSRAQLDLVFNVKSAFYSLVNATRLVDVNVKNVDNRQRQLDLARARLNRGLGLPSDVVTAETAKAQAILALTVVRDSEQQARVSLLQTMGVDPMTPVDLAVGSEQPFADADPRSLVKEALASRPEIKGAERALDATQFGLSAAKSLNLPAIYAAVSAGGAGSAFPLTSNSAALGIGVQFPLLDGGTRSGAVIQARGQVRTALSDLETAVLAVRADVTSAYLALEAAQQRVALAEAEVANSREGVRIAEGRYRAGLGSFLDVTTAQALLLTSLTDQSTVQESLDLARARLRHAVGAPLQ